MHVHSFPPVIDSKSRLLVLGTMPGRLSLEAGEYYAHPRNLFWEIIFRCVGVSRKASYGDRIAWLADQGIALWDVLKTCTRTSSLDSDIVGSSTVANDFRERLGSYPSVRTICFNGAKAEALFRRYVAPTLPGADDLRLRSLPSTSPANAGIPFEVKVERWRQALGALRSAQQEDDE